jgi:hypothetical protein
MPDCLFDLGRTVSTPGALQALLQAGESGLRYLLRHSTGDWGEVDAEDRRTNDRAVRQGERIVSSYTLPTGEKLWVITERDRSATTLLLPSEY